MSVGLTTRASMSLLVFVFLLITGSWATIPHGWQACKMSSSDYNNCMIKQINSAIQTLKGGSKQLGVGPIDPLRILSLGIDQGSGPVSIKLNFNDILVTGLSSCVLETFKNNNWEKMEGRAKCKTLMINGPYKIEGKVLTLPIKGEGISKIVNEDVLVDIVLILKEVEKSGKKHFHVEEFGVDIKPTKISYNFENLFNGNKVLSDNMNTFLNENSDQIYKELKPAVSKAFSEAYSQITNQIFSKIPSNEIKIK